MMHRIDVQLFIFVGLLIVGAFVYVTGILSTPLDAPAKPVRVRLLSLVGFLVVGALIFLGAAWPSIYSIIAAPTIPALIVLAAVIVRPRLLERRRILRAYLVIDRKSVV